MGGAVEVENYSCRMGLHIQVARGTSARGVMEEGLNTARGSGCGTDLCIAGGGGASWLYAWGGGGGDSNLRGGGGGDLYLYAWEVVGIYACKHRVVEEGICKCADLGEGVAMPACGGDRVHEVGLEEEICLYGWVAMGKDARVVICKCGEKEMALLDCAGVDHEVGVVTDACKRLGEEGEI
ncbi:hypothetical protein ACLOJK_025450 [Asimina triloba]